MARPLRVEFEGAIHHVTVRGNARHAIFLDDRDRERFVERLGEGVKTYDIRLYLFCLMGNHLHLVVETPRANLGRFMQGLQTAYAVYFNLRHGRVGHLVQGRYSAQLVAADAYLLRLSRYVHLNPVFVGRVRRLPLAERLEHLRGYRWSSYRGYVGLAKPLGFVAQEPVLAQVAPTARSRTRRAGEYREFVERGLVETDADLLELRKASPRAIGGQSYRQWVDRLYAKLLGRRQKKEDVAFGQRAVAAEAEEILDILSGELGLAKEDLCRRMRGSMARPIAAHLLCRYAGLTQRAVARRLGLGTGAAVSMQLSRLRQALPNDRKLAKQLAALERRVEAIPVDEGGRGVRP